MKKNEYNRIYKVIILDENGKIITIGEYVDFYHFYRAIDNLMVHSYTDIYEYSDEFIDCEEGCLYIEIKKKLSVDY